MKIVDRKTFLQMPKGTVFCKFPLRFDGDGEGYCFGIGAPRILEWTSEVDFGLTRLGSDLNPNGETSADHDCILFKMQENLGMEVPFEHWSGRDGLYEDDSVGFAIYSREEVQEMIDLLQQALIDGYGEHKENQEKTERGV